MLPTPYRPYRLYRPITDLPSSRLTVLPSLLLLSACDPPPGQEATFPVPAIEWAPASYTALRAESPVVVDGRLDDEAWRRAARTDPFLDIRGEAHPDPRFRTTAMMSWDDEYLYVAAELEEPHVWGRITERDAVIYRDNDFEVFIDPNGDTHEYYELEINALGTEWDLFLGKPYRDGGPALHAWDIPGLRTAVGIDGTLNDPSDIDEGWTVEIAFPWSVLREASRIAAPPVPGDVWRVNFSRVQWQVEVEQGGYVKSLDAVGDTLPEDNWVWSPQGLVAMHYPEMWGFVRFDSATTSSAAPVHIPAAERIRGSLYSLYYAQRRFRERNGFYAASPRQLQLAASLEGVVIQATDSGYEAFVRLSDGTRVSVDETGRSVIRSP